MAEVKNAVYSAPIQMSELSSYNSSEAVQRDATKFEGVMQHYENTVSDMFPAMFSEDQTVNAAKLQAAGIGEEENRKIDQKKEFVVRSLGDAILKGMENSSDELSSAYRAIQKLMAKGDKPFSPSDLLRLNAMVLNATITVDITTRVVSKVSTGVDTLLRIQ